MDERPQKEFLHEYCIIQKEQYEITGDYYKSFEEFPDVVIDSFFNPSYHFMQKRGEFYENLKDYNSAYPEFPIKVRLGVRDDGFTVITVKNVDKDDTPNVLAISEDCKIVTLIDDYYE